MRSVRARTTIEIPGYALQEVDFMQGVNNAVTLLTHTINRPADVCPLNADQLVSWITTSLSVVQDGQKDRAALLNELSTGKTFNPVNVFLKDYYPVIAALLSPTKRVPNYSRFLTEQLTLMGVWDQKFVSSVETGYPIEIFECNQKLLAPGQVLGLPSSADEGADNLGFSGLRKTFAWLTAIFDLLTLSVRLIPNATSLTSNARNPRENPLGPAEVALGQRDALVALGLLWYSQFDAFWLHCNIGTIKFRLDLAERVMPREKPIFDGCRTLVDTAMKAVPLHPVWSSIASCFGPGSVDTLFGKHACYFIQSGTVYFPTNGKMPTVEKSDAKQVPTTPKGTPSPFNRETLASCISESLRLADRADTSLAESVLQGILHNVPGSTTSSSVRNARSLSRLVEFLHLQERYTKLWSGSVNQLGWKNLVAAPPAELDAVGAEFCLTDGDMTSRHPSMILAGLTPVFAVNNWKLTGNPERYSAAFNTGPDPRGSFLLEGNNGSYSSAVRSVYSVITATGHISSSQGPMMFSRHWMPMSMHLGEMNPEIRYFAASLGGQRPGSANEFVEASPDPIGSTIVGWYNLKSPSGFVRSGVTEPVRLDSKASQTEEFYRTSWIAWAGSTTSANACQDTLLAAYGPDNKETSVGAYAFYFRQTGWKIRSVAQAGRTNQLVMFDELGNFIQTQKYRGEVLFEADVTLSHTTAWTDQFIDLLVNASDNRLDDAQEAKAPEVSEVVR